MPQTEAGYVPCDARDDTFEMDGPADEGAGYPDLMHDDNDYYGPGRDPIQWDCKPYGFGIDRFEDPALQEANEYAAGKVLLAFSMYQPVVDPCGKDYGLVSAARMEIRNQRWAANSRHDKALERQSDQEWDRLCDECQTHREAVERYTRWAKQVTDGR
jgi:hypothetical protein